MKYFEIVNKRTGEHEILIGKSYPKTMLAAGFNAEDYTLIMTENVYEEDF